MSIDAPVGSKRESKPVPAGNHIARVYSIVHIGTIPGEWQGKAKMNNKVRIGFELPNEKAVFREGDQPKPFVINQNYTLSMYENAQLRKLVEGILGVGFLDEDAKSFDVIDLMGRTCMLNVIHSKTQKGAIYGKIMSAAPLPKGIEGPPPVNPPFVLDYGSNWDNEKFNGLPEFIQDDMRLSREYRKKFGGADVEYPTEEINPDDVPF